MGMMLFPTCHEAHKFADGKLNVTLAAGVQRLSSVLRNIPYHSIFSVSAETINNL
jgi:hypothetical protein